MATVVSNDSASPESSQSPLPKERLRLSDWVRIALPIVFVIAFMVVAWRLGYFKLRHPQHIGAAADRVRDVPWLGPIFVAVYATMGAFAAPVFATRLRRRRRVRSDSRNALRLAGVAHRRRGGLLDGARCVGRHSAPTARAIRREAPSPARAEHVFS